MQTQSTKQTKMNEKTRKKDLSLTKVRSLTISKREELISNRILKDCSKRKENERLKESTLSSISRMRIQIKRTRSIKEKTNSLSNDLNLQSLTHSQRKSQQNAPRHQNLNLLLLSNSDLQPQRSSQQRHPPSQRNQINVIQSADTNNYQTPGDKINSSLQTKAKKKAENQISQALTNGKPWSRQHPFKRRKRHP